MCSLITWNMNDEESLGHVFFHPIHVMKEKCKLLTVPLQTYARLDCGAINNQIQITEDIE